MMRVLIFWYLSVIVGQGIALYVGFSGSTLWILAPLSVYLTIVDVWFRKEIGGKEKALGAGLFIRLFAEHVVSLAGSWCIGWFIAWLLG